MEFSERERRCCEALFPGLCMSLVGEPNTTLDVICRKSLVSDGDAGRKAVDMNVATMDRQKRAYDAERSS
jgi:hypothetical protein